MISISCTNFAMDPIQDTLDRLVGEFGAWEIFSEAEHSIVYHADEFADLLPSYDMLYTVHAPICDLNIAALGSRLREASMNEISSTVESASELGLGMVTVHPGLSSMAVAGTESRALENAKAAMKRLDSLSDEYGMVIAVENMPELHFFLGRTAKQLSEIIEGTGLKVCFDIGHANTTGQIDAMIELLGDRMANIHIHDNMGETDQHLTIGEGNVDFDTLIPRLGFYEGSFVIESRNLDSGLKSRDSLDRMLDM